MAPGALSPDRPSLVRALKHRSRGPQLHAADAHGAALLDVTSSGIGMTFQLCSLTSQIINSGRRAHAGAREYFA